MQKMTKKKRPGSRSETLRRSKVNAAAEAPSRPGPRKNPNRHSKS